MSSLTSGSSKLVFTYSTMFHHLSDYPEKVMSKFTSRSAPSPFVTFDIHWSEEWGENRCGFYGGHNILELMGQN